MIFMFFDEKFCVPSAAVYGLIDKHLTGAFQISDDEKGVWLFVTMLSFVNNPKVA